MVKLNMYKFGDFREMLRTHAKLRSVLKPSEREAFLEDLEEYAGYQFDTSTVKKFIYSKMHNTRDREKYSLQDLKSILRALDDLK